MDLNGNYTNIVLIGLDRYKPSSFVEIFNLYSERYTSGTLKILEIRRPSISEADIMVSLDMGLPANVYEEYMDVILADILTALYSALGIDFKENQYTHSYVIPADCKGVATTEAKKGSKGIRIITPEGIRKYHIDAMRNVFGYSAEAIQIMLETEVDLIDGSIYLPKEINESNISLVKKALNKLGIKYEFEEHHTEQVI